MIAFVTIPDSVQAISASKYHATKRMLRDSIKAYNSESRNDADLTPLQRVAEFCLIEWQASALAADTSRIPATFSGDVFFTDTLRKHSDAIWAWDTADYYNQFTVTPDDIEDIFAALGDWQAGDNFGIYN
jgi:hypothetical protein